MKYSELLSHTVEYLKQVLYLNSTKRKHGFFVTAEKNYQKKIERGFPAEK